MKNQQIETVPGGGVKKDRRAYYKEWRRKNPEKVAAIKARYYAKKLREMAETGGAGDGE